MTQTDPEATMPDGARPRRPARLRPHAPTLAALVATLSAAACMGTGPASSPTPAPSAPVATAPAPAAPAAPAAVNDTPGTWRQPDSVVSVNGLLDVTMAIVQRTVNVPLDSALPMTLQMYQLLSASGQTVDTTPSYPAPTLIAHPGDRVRIKLYDRLGPSDNNHCMNYPAADSGRDTMPECFHGPTWSNIHFHGFHVTPQDSGDNVLVMIQPGDSFQYSFQIPTNQAAGTMWYHPHKHGSVALEVSNAMSGAFIVRDTSYGLDSLTAAYGMKEYVAAVQQVDSTMNLVDSNFASKTTVNGLGNAEIPIRPGEVVRVRLVNENVSNSAQFSVFFNSTSGLVPTLYDVARDGVQYANANYLLGGPDTSLFIYPGNRLDVFVKAPAASSGTFDLEARPLFSLSSRKLLVANLPRVNRLVRFRVVQPRAGEVYDTTLPPALPALPSFLSNIGQTKDTAYVVFTDTGFTARNPPGTPTQFYLGTQKNPYMRFDDTLVYVPLNAAGRPVPMILGDSQTWIIQHNGTFNKNHPFHIHTNPFQVLQVKYGASDPFATYYAFLNQAAANGNPIWSDVMPLPQQYVDSTTKQTMPGQIMIAQRYDPFTGCPNCGPAWGQFVMHCHILGHEERGMMQLLEIFPSQAAALEYMLAHPDALKEEGATVTTRRTTTRTRPRPSSGSGRGSGARTGGGSGARPSPTAATPMHHH